jgi:hypothetical protein
MIKELIVTVALLAPGLAHGQNLSASSTHQAVAVGSDPIACDVGPNYIGSIPAPAQAAGFTHCVANYDFTQTGPFINGGNTYQWSNLSSWLECAGASSPLLFTINYGIPGNCNDISITTDGGTQVLQMIYTPSDTSGQTWLSTDSNRGYPNSAGVRTHIGFYVEEDMRVTANTFNTCASWNPGCIYFAFWKGEVQGSCTNNCANQDIELDVVEMYGNGSGGGNGTSGGGSGCCGGATYSNISGYDRTQYNIYGALGTATNGGSGSTNLEYCWILNEVSPSVSCGTAAVDYNELAGVTMEWYPAMVGPQRSDNACGSNRTQSCSPTGNQVVLIQRMTIWSCSGYSGNSSGFPCYTSSLVGY